MPIKRAHKISTVNFRHSSHLGTKSNYSGSTNVLLPSFTAQALGFFIRKFAPRQADDDNYHNKSTSLYVLPKSHARGLNMRTHLTAVFAHAHSFDRCVVTSSIKEREASVKHTLVGLWYVL